MLLSSHYRVLQLEICHCYSSVSIFYSQQQGRMQGFPKGGVETRDTKCGGEGGGGGGCCPADTKSGEGGGAV